MAKALTDLATGVTLAIRNVTTHAGVSCPNRRALSGSPPTATPSWTNAMCVAIRRTFSASAAP